MADPSFDELEEKFRAAFDRMEKPSRDGLDSALAEPCDDERTLVLVAVRRMHDIVRLAEAGAPEAQAVLMLLSSSLSLAALGAGGGGTASAMREARGRGARRPSSGAPRRSYRSSRDVAYAIWP